MARRYTISAAESQRRAARMRDMNAALNGNPERKQAAGERLAKGNKTPHAREASGERLRELFKNPEFREAHNQRLADPEFQKKALAARLASAQKQTLS